MTTTRQLLVTTALAAGTLFSAGAFAQEATPDSWLQSVQSTKSRADVNAELAAARQSGLTKAWSAGYIEPVRHSALRAEVRAQTLQAIASAPFLVSPGANICTFNARFMKALPVSLKRLW